MKMHRLFHKSLSLWLLALSASLAATAQAEDYPTRPVKIISDSAPGSAVDVTLRMVADRLGQIWGQQVLPVNQPGAGGTISARVAAEAAPDGYTLYMPELIALAKQRPGEISYAVTGVGRLTHLTGELLQLRTGIKLLLVPYSGGPSHSLNDIMGGRIPLIIEGYQGLARAIQGGDLKPLAVASAERLPDFPDVPTVAETVPGFKAMGWQGLVSPVGTPEAIVRKASEDLRKVVSDPTLKAQLAGRGSYPLPMSPAEVTAFIRDQQQQWSPVLRQLAAQP